MDNIIKITNETEKKFSSFKFYNRLLKDVSEYYRSEYYSKSHNPPSFSFFEKSTIDPITLPLIITLGEYIKLFHEKFESEISKPILYLENDLHKNDVLKFLYYSDFFKIVGEKGNIGRNIFSFDERMIGAFSNERLQNPDHKVRGYSLNDDDLWIKLISIEGLEDKRDYLIQHFTYIVNDHFKDLLNSTYAIYHKNEFIDILSELITNGLIHSGSDVYVMMFTNRFKTTFSISDCGRGLFKSISEKNDNIYYKSLSLFEILKKRIPFNMSSEVQESVFSIFETLFYSTLKDRKGIIDLIINIVNRYNGTFRIHNVNVQIIISSRMYNEIYPIIEHRNEILELWNRKKFNLISQDLFDKTMYEKADKVNNLFTKLAESIFLKHSEDIQYSSIRFYNIQFNGVHIEAEIPQKN